MNNTKKIFIIAVIVLVVLVGALLIYNLFFKTVSPTATGEPSAPAARETNGSQNGNLASLKLKAISQEKVFSPSIGENGETVKYFLRTNGHIFESDFNGGNLKEKSSVTLDNPLKALWSPDKEKVIGIFNENGQVKKYFYNYTSGQSAPLPDQIAYIAWSPDSKKIAYQFSPTNSDESSISIADPDGSNYKNIFRTRLNNLIVDWPITAKISLLTPISGLSQGLVYALNSANGELSTVLTDYYGLNIKWSPKADKLLFSSTDSSGKNPILRLANETGSNTKDLRTSTIADKCVWSKDDRSVFCAIPQEISPNAVWPDDYYKGRVIVNDDFYKINLETNEKTKIAGSSELTGYDAQELFLSPKEDYLFFVNRRDGLLYSLRL